MSVDKQNKDMENFRKRLDFPNISVKTRVLSKVVESVSNKIINQLIPDQEPELSLLWDKCNDESPVTSKLCCQTIFSLVCEKKLNSLSFVDEFLALVTSFKHIGILVQTVNDLLLLNLNEQLEHDNTYCCPYSTTTPIHPFIVILRERAESWPVVYQCMHSIIKQELHNGMQMMKSVICHVLLEPSSSYSSTFRTLLYSDLLSLEEGRKFVFSCLPLLQLKNLAELMEAVFIIERLYISISEKTNPNDIETLLLTSLSLCQTLANHGFPRCNLILMCKEILNGTKISALSICICIVILSVLITDAVGTELYHLLCLGQVLLKQNGIIKSISSTLVLPLLSILCGEHDNSIKTTAAKVIVAFEQYNYEVDHMWSENESKEYAFIGFHPLTSLAMQYVIMLNCIEKMDEESAKEKWLDSIVCFIQLKADLPPLLIHVIAGILINSHSIIINKKCLLALEAIATIQPQQGMAFFPLLLYKIKFETDPELNLIILESLPSVATHTYSVGAILNTIQLLAHYPKLKPLAIHLMTLLWKKQERCFSHLKRMLDVDSSDAAGDFNRVLISQASAMKYICDIRPHLDGINILANISKIFNTCSSDASSPAVVLALQGVSSLCKAEAIDLRTAWKALARKLANDKRPLVLKHLFGLLSLAPQLKTSSSHYDKFIATAADMLWKHVRTQTDPITVGAAYAALGQYSSEYHQLKVLPDVAKAKIVPPRVSTPLDLSKNIEELLGYTPGYCFVHLLESITNNNISIGYEDFLTGLLRYEINNMPKNIYHTGKIAVKQTKQDRLFSSIPEFLCVRYNENSQPGIQGNLAFGVLLSYHPPVEVDRDGNPTKKSILSQAEFYQQMLEPLLQDVTIDTSDWYQCILLSYSWCEFMDRAYISCIESEYVRKEIEEKQHGSKLTMEQEDNFLHIQDGLLKIIQKQAKGKPTSQANALLAVVGLTVSVWKHELSLNQSGPVSSDNYKCYNLILATLETLLCALEPTRKSSTQVFSWLIAGQRGGISSLILQGYVAITFFHLVPFLMQFVSEKIRVICEFLLHQIVRRNGSILQLHCGIGLGLTLQAICREQSHTCTTANVSVIDITKQLESLCIGNNDEIQLGAFIGLSLAGISLCHSEDEKAQVRGREIQAFCVHLLRKVDPLSVSYDVLAECTSIITASAQVKDVLAPNEYKEILEVFNAYRSERPQCSGSATAVGTMVGLLHNTGFLSPSKEKDNLIQTWKSIVLSEKMPILHRIAALKGMSSLYDIYNCINSVDNKNIDVTDLHDVIEVAMKLSQTRDVTLKNMAIRLLGEISRIPRGSDRSLLPTSYFYLDDKYVLKYVMDYVIKQANTSLNEDSSNLMICLRLLGKDYPKPFPPISWPTVLTPFLQKNEIVEACVKILVSHCAASSSVSSFLGTLIRRPQIVSSSRHILLSSLPVLLKSLPIIDLKYFASAIILPSLCDSESLHTYGKTVLEAILETLSLPELPLANHEIIKTLIINLTETCFVKYVTHFQELKLTAILCSCLTKLQTDTLKQMCDEMNPNLIPALILCCGLIKLDKLPFNFVNSFLDTGAVSSRHTQEEVIKILMHLFETYYLDTNIEKLKVVSSWILELMGRIKSNSQHASTPDNIEIDFLLCVFAATIIGFSGALLACVVQTNIGMHERNCQLLSALSSTLPLFLSKEPWNYLIDKMLDFLLFLLTSNRISEQFKMNIFSALCSLRGFKEFAKYSVFSQVFNLQLRQMS